MKYSCHTNASQRELDRPVEENPTIARVRKGVRENKSAKNLGVWSYSFYKWSRCPILFAPADVVVPRPAQQYPGRLAMRLDDTKMLSYKIRQTVLAESPSCNRGV